MKPFATYTHATGLRWIGIKRPANNRRYQFRIVIRIDENETDIRMKGAMLISEMLPIALSEMTDIINLHPTATNVSFQLYIWG